MEVRRSRKRQTRFDSIFHLMRRLLLQQPDAEDPRVRGKGETLTSTPIRPSSAANAKGPCDFLVHRPDSAAG